MYSGRIKKYNISKACGQNMSKSVNQRRKASFEANTIEIPKKRLMIDVRERYHIDGGVGPRNGGNGIHRMLILSTFRWDHYF
jgi:hypothetical protein